MSSSPFHRLVACALAMALCVPAAHAQDAATLKRENQRLSSELAALRIQCRAGNAPVGGSAVSGEQRIGALGFEIISLRAVAESRGQARSTLTLKIRNLGSAPVILNYKHGSFSLVDEHGYGYRLGHWAGFGDPVGISTATDNRAGTADLIQPGDSINVTFVSGRNPLDGQSVGNAFDLSATFVAVTDLGEGPLRVGRTYPVAFVGVPRSAGAPAVGESVRQGGKNVVDSVLKGLFGNGN